MFLCYFVPSISIWELYYHWFLSCFVSFFFLLTLAWEVLNLFLVFCRVSLKSPWSRRRRKHALLPKQWRSFHTPDGKLCDGGLKFLKKVRSGVCSPFFLRPCNFSSVNIKSRFHCLFHCCCYYPSICYC